MSEFKKDKTSKQVHEPKSNLKKHENKFKTVQIVGKGTFGKVYKVYKTKNPHRYYAIKKISV